MDNDIKWKIESLMSKEELRRLEKAAREKDKTKLADWARGFEQQIDSAYERYYKEQLGISIDNFILTIVYTLHFNESTRFGNQRIEGFMEDLLETIDMFRRGEASPEDYRQQLKEDKINVKGRN